MPLKDWYFNRDATDEQFYELMDDLGFELMEGTLQNGVIVYYLKNKGERANIEQDVFCANQRINTKFTYTEKSAEQRLDIKANIIERLRSLYAEIGNQRRRDEDEDEDDEKTSICRLKERLAGASICTSGVTG